MCLEDDGPDLENDSAPFVSVPCACVESDDNTRAAEETAEGVLRSRSDR